MTGKILQYDGTLTPIERLYVRILGAPISGLRIRCRRILPKIDRLYKKILDVGSGTGVLTAEIASRWPGSQVLGVDNSQTLVDKCNRMVQKADIKNCRFQQADASNLNFAEEFDLALCIDNLEHIEDDIRVLENIHRSLTKEGRAIIHVPHFFRRWPVFTWQENFSVPGHVRPGYRWEELMEKMEIAGFYVEEAFFTYGVLETFTNNVSYSITSAEMKNKILYAFVFPWLNLLAYFGQYSKPKMGAGIFVMARKK